MYDYDESCYSSYFGHAWLIFIKIFAVNVDSNSAKVLLLRASSSSDQKKWVGQLTKKIPKRPPQLSGESFGAR